jgi:hypothetical protein
MISKISGLTPKGVKGVLSYLRETRLSVLPTGPGSLQLKRNYVR